MVPRWFNVIDANQSGDHASVNTIHSVALTH